MPRGRSAHASRARYVPNGFDGVGSTHGRSCVLSIQTAAGSGCLEFPYALRNCPVIVDDGHVRALDKPREAYGAGSAIPRLLRLLARLAVNRGSGSLKA